MVQVTLGWDSLGCLSSSLCTSLCPGEVGPCGKEASPPPSETLAKSQGKATEWSLVVWGIPFTVGVLMAVSEGGGVTRAGWIQTSLSIPADASDRLPAKGSLR